MARILSATGFTTVYCTPHVIKGAFEKSPAEIKGRVALLQQQLLAASIPLQLLAAAEYYLDEYLTGLLDEPLPLGDTKQLLLEIPDHAEVDFVKETCFRIRCSGYTPLIAHPERCKLLAVKAPSRIKGALQSLFNRYSLHSKFPPASPDPTLLQYLQQIGCRFQGNIGSFAGAYGERVRQQALNILAHGLYDCFGSDAHHAAKLKDTLQRGRQSPLQQ